MVKLISRSQCPSCAIMGKDSRQDNLVTYADEGSYCFSCGHYVSGYSKPLVLEGMSTSVGESSYSGQFTDARIYRYPSILLIDRNLKSSVTALYGVKSNVVGCEETHRYYPRTTDGILTGYKVRTLPKSFSNVGSSGKDLFGQVLFDKDKKLVIVTAGEEDALSAYQITAHCSPTKRGYPSVSLPNGINSKQCVKDNIEWLNSFERVVFAVDQEEAELAIARDYCSMLAPGKGRLARFALKDASEMCVAKRYTEFYNAIWNAPEVSPSGIVEGESIWTEYQKKNDYKNLPFPEGWGMSWSYGLYRPALFVLTAGTSAGKSTVLKHLQYHVFSHTADNIGVITMEEPISLCAGILIGMHMKKRITLPDSKVDENEEQASYKVLFDSGRFTFCTSEGLRSATDLFSKIRYMVVAKDCKYIFLDHLTAIINKCTITDKASKNDHTEFMVNRLNELCQELKVCLVLVSHVRKTSEDSGQTYETGKIPLEDSIFGSSAIKQYSHCTMALSRNKGDPDAPMYLHILKDRLSGRLGKSVPLLYNVITGWLEPDQSLQEDQV